MQTRSPRSVMQAETMSGLTRSGLASTSSCSSGRRRPGPPRGPGARRPSAAAVYLLERHADGGLELGALAQVIVLDRSGILKVLVDQLVCLRVERRALAGRRRRTAPRPRAQSRTRRRGAQGQRPAGPRSLLPERLLLRRRHEGLLVVHVHCYCSLLFTVLIASFLGGSALLLLTSAGSAEAQLFGNAVVVPIRFPVSKLCCSLRAGGSLSRRVGLCSPNKIERRYLVLGLPELSYLPARRPTMAGNVTRGKPENPPANLSPFGCSRAATTHDERPLCKCRDRGRPLRRRRRRDRAAAGVC